jgi:hypothetical protein
MLNVRSRSGVVAVTCTAAVFLALPVVAAGQVPGVDQVLGGVTQTAESLVAAPVTTPAPAPAPAPPAPAPKPAPQAAPAPAAPAPAPGQTAPRGSTSTGSAGAGTATSGATASSSAKQGASKKRATAAAASDDKASAAQDEDAGPTDVQIADQAAEAPADASPSTLPFTGLQLTLMAMLGLAAIAGGAALRRAT